MTTKRQKAAVRFCEEVLYNIKFEGDIENFNEVSSFLGEYLQDAKDAYDEAYEEQRAWVWEQLMK